MTSATAVLPLSSRARWAGAQFTRGILLAAILGCLALQAMLVGTQAINWDEFRFLADVHLLARGELTASVQTFHSHFFSWLMWLPGHEVDQIIAARMVMLLLEVGTATMLYQCARRFADVEASLLAVLCYLSLSYVMRHGASFRFDPPSTFLLMGAVTLLTTARLRTATAVAAGALVAVAALITIKSAFYVPTLAVIAWWRAHETAAPRGALMRLGAGALAGAAVLALLYYWHQSYIAAGSLGAAQGIVSSSVDKTIGQSHIFPGARWLSQSILQSPLNWLILTGGAALSLHGLWGASKGDRLRALALFSLIFPLATLLFYRNAFPYYYAFMLAPVAVPAACAARYIAKRIRLDILGVVLLVPPLLNAITASSPTLAAQRTVLDAAHSIFPGPVDYIDRCSMMASLRKQGFFMSTWGTEVYRDAGRPIMRELLLKTRPAFVILNSPILEWAVAGIGADRRMLPADAALLRDNFIPHWGPIWVAGKHLRLSDRPTDFEMLVAGRYTIESPASVTIDDVPHQSGAVVEFRAGRHSVKGVALGQSLTLRWGDHLRRPAAPPPATELFENF